MNTSKWANEPMILITVISSQRVSECVREYRIFGKVFIKLQRRLVLVLLLLDYLHYVFDLFSIHTEL